METVEIYINKINDEEWKSLREKLGSSIIGTKTNKSARVLVVAVKKVGLVLQIITNVIKVSGIKNVMNKIIFPFSFDRIVISKDEKSRSFKASVALSNKNGSPA